MPFSQVFELYLVMKFNNLRWIKLLLINSEKLMKFIYDRQ
jgi:hypothetical protein